MDRYGSTTLTNSASPSVQLERFGRIGAERRLTLLQNGLAVDCRFARCIRREDGQRNVPAKDSRPIDIERAASTEYAPYSVIFSLHDVTRCQKPILTDMPLAIFLFDSDNRISDLPHPIVHHFCDVNTSRFRNAVPEVERLAVAVEVTFQIDAYAPQEVLFPYIFQEHTKH